MASIGQWQMVECQRWRVIKIIAFDEPTSSLSARERQSFSALFVNCEKEGG